MHTLLKGLTYRITQSLTFLLLLLFLLPTQSIATTTFNPDTYKSNLASAGITYIQSGNTLEIQISTQQVTAAEQGLEDTNMIPEQDLYTTELTPTLLSVNVVAIPLSINILKTIYQQNPNIDTLHIHAYIQSSDSSAKQSCYTFNTTRQFIATLTDENASTNYFTSHAPEFKMDKWCKDQIAKELT